MTGQEETFLVEGATVQNAWGQAGLFRVSAYSV